MSGDLLFDIVKDLLADYLGEYKPIDFPDVIFPAINLGSDTPVGFEVSGLEVLVAKSPAVSSRPIIGGDVLSQHTINVLLRQWDPDGTTALAVERLIRRFPQASVGALVPATRDTLEQVTVYFVDSTILNGV